MEARSTASCEKGNERHSGPTFGLSFAKIHVFLLDYFFFVMPVHDVLIVCGSFLSWGLKREEE